MKRLADISSNLVLMLPIFEQAKLKPRATSQEQPAIFKTDPVFCEDASSSSGRACGDSMYRTGVQSMKSATSICIFVFMQGCTQGQFGRVV